MKRALFLVLMACLGACTASSPQHAPRLTLFKVYPVECPENFQPSGLTRVDERLYTISDKHDRFIYRLDLENDRAVAVPAVPIPETDGTLFQKMDFEGITHDDAGNFYLASEKQSNILRVSSTGEIAEWLTPDLGPAGKNAGLFQKHNAGLEGICRISGDKFLVCAEREPRGFVEIDLAARPVRYRAAICEKSRFGFPKGMSLDFSGLYKYKTVVYVLERNAFVVCRLIPGGEYVMEGPGWSFHHVETAPPFRYADMEYGKAEGLCVDDRFIYIMIDNNNDARAENPDDRRPLLMVFYHPENF